MESKTTLCLYISLVLSSLKKSIFNVNKVK